MAFLIEGTILLTSLLCLLVLIYVKKSQKYWLTKKVPHLAVTSFWGHMENPIGAKRGLKYDLKNAYDELKKRGHKHGGIYLFMQPVYMIVHPETIKMILSKDFQYFTGRGLPHNEEMDPLTEHLFHLEGERWRNMRVKLTPTFTSGKMRQMFGTLLDCGVPMLERIGELSSDKSPLDIKEILACYTTDVIGSCAFGLECNSFKDPDAEFRRYGRQIFEPKPRSRFTQFLAFVLPKVMKMSRIKVIPDDMEAFFIGAIKKVVDHRAENGAHRNDFVQILMEMQEKAREVGEQLLTIEQIAAQCFVFFAAGFETSSTTMAFCLHELAYNQDIQEKVRAEIRNAMKECGGKLTYDGVMGMKYLDMVVNETLRKYPPAPMLFRKSDADYKLSEVDGAVLPTRTTVFVSVLGLHMDEEYYPDPDRFDPDRFNDQNKAKRPNYTFIPFGEGPRICIGARFALMQVKTGISMLLDKYRILPSKGESYKIEFDPKLVMLMKKGKLILNAEPLENNF